jgi:hypothetical protein
VTTETLLGQLERWLPPHWKAAEPVLAAVAAPMAAAVEVLDDMVDSTTIDGAEGKWLTLLARGYGVVRTDSETDDGLRSRLQNVERKVTRLSILSAVDALLASYTVIHAIMVEWFKPGGAFYLDDGYLDTGRLLGEYNTFYLFLPMIGEPTWGDLYLGSDFLDDEYVGGGPSHPVYVAITAEVDRIRAAGVRAVAIILD